jgi:amylosucrase
MGDEFGLGNTSQAELAVRKGPDGRELHRPYWPQDKADLRQKAGSVEHKIFSKIQKLSQLRKAEVAFKGDSDVTLLPNTHRQVLGLQRNRELIGLFNFSNQSIVVNFSDLKIQGAIDSSQKTASVQLKPYQFIWAKIATDLSPTIVID